MTTRPQRIYDVMTTSRYPTMTAEDVACALDEPVLSVSSTMSQMRALYLDIVGQAKSVGVKSWHVYKLKPGARRPAERLLRDAKGRTMPRVEVAAVVAPEPVVPMARPRRFVTVDRQVMEVVWPA